MKALVFLLVLVNLLFYAFGAGYFGRPENPDAGRLEQQVQPERMRIVSRGEAPAKQPAASVADEIKRELPSAQSEASPAVCLLWEHLNKADADRLQALLTDKFAEFKVQRRAELSEGAGWWVSIPPLAGKAEADKKAGELRRLGVTDYFVLQEGPHRFAISLGIFSSEKGAQERLAELTAIGVRSARLTPRPGKDAGFSLQASGPQAAQAALLEAVGQPSPKLDAQSCP